MANPTGMRVWAYKIGLIKPKPKPERPAIVYEQLRAKSLQQLKREAAIAAGEVVSPLSLDQATKDQINADIKERADDLGLKDAHRREFEKVMRDALRRAVQEGRAYKEKCDIEQRKLINQEVERRLALAVPNLQKEKDEATRFRKHYEELINNHKPVFTIEEFRTVLKALHPDTATKETAAKAFPVFETRKFRLTGVK